MSDQRPDEPFGDPRLMDYNRFIEFVRHHVGPPAIVYVTRDDIIELVVAAPITATTVNLTLRFQSPDGQVLPRFESASFGPTGGTPATKQFTNAEGFLVSASVETPGGTRGQAYIVLRIRRGAGSSDTAQGNILISGYPSAVAGLAYPGSGTASPVDGRGRIRVVTVANPAAGADWTLTVPPGVAWIIRGVRALLASSATVATRVATLFIQNATPTIFFLSGASQTQAASLTINYAWLNSALLMPSPQPAEGGLPGELLLPAGFTLGTTSGGLQVGDQWSAIAVGVEEFIGG